MANLISTAEQSGILAVFENSFDTWSRSIVVYKQPLKTLVSPTPSTSTNPFGFGEEQQESLYTYTPVSGTYQAIIRYNDIERDLSEHAPLLTELLAHVYAGPVSIKVKKACRDYINDGETERIVVDDQTYLQWSDERKQTYLGSEYYIFTLRKTK